jgi:hypothetical protein
MAILLFSFACGDAGGVKKPYRVGLVNFVSGKAFIIGRNGKETPASVGLPVDVGMKVKTAGKNSFCEIYFNDNAVKVFGDSVLSVDVLTFNVKDNADKTSLVLEKGKVFSRIPSKLVKNERFVVKSPTCLASVRGTEFFVTENRGRTIVSCLDGKVDVRQPRKKAPGVVLEENEEAAVIRSKPIAKREIDDALADKLEKDAEVKPVTAKNSELFDELNNGDQKAVTKVKGKIKSISGDTSSEDKDGKYDVDVFFFKG